MDRAIRAALDADEHDLAVALLALLRRSGFGPLGAGEVVDLVGPERLADVMLDLDGDALAACLADPNAT